MSAIQAALQQPAPSGVTPRDLVVVQENFNRALQQMQTGALVQAKNPPASSTSPGDAGQFVLTSSWLYLCVAKNTWRRVALAVF